MTAAQSNTHSLNVDHAADAFAELPNGVTLCYRESGNPAGEPIVLIAGLMEDLTSWPTRFLDELAGRGFRIIRFDNRDAGRSTRINTPPPTPLQQLFSRARPDAYTLEDMAHDTIMLLDELGIDHAHLVGRSMGGMIAQTVAAERPDKVLTLVSLYSTTGDPKVGQAAFSTKRKFMATPATTLQAHLSRSLNMVAHLAGRGYPYDEDTEVAHARVFWQRAAAAGPLAKSSGARQIQAIAASGDRTPRVRTITAPTLIINGDRDLIVHPSGGEALARAIPDAHHVVIPGMGHHFAPGLIEQLATEVERHIRRGDAR